MTTFHLEILKPSQTLFSGKVDSLQVTAQDGQLEVWFNHAALLTVLVPGKLAYNLADKGRVEIAASDGILHVKDGAAKIYLT